MVAEKFPDASTVTKDMNNSWLSLRSIYPRTLLNDANAVRQFYKYLNGIGVEGMVFQAVGHNTLMGCEFCQAAIGILKK